MEGGSYPARSQGEGGGGGGTHRSMIMVRSATVDQVYNHLELRAVVVCRMGETLPPGRIQGHYCGNGDRILPFQIEKNQFDNEIAPAPPLPTLRRCTPLPPSKSIPAISYSGLYLNYLKKILFRRLEPFLFVICTMGPSTTVSPLTKGGMSTQIKPIDLMHNDVTRLDASEECWSS